MSSGKTYAFTVNVRVKRGYTGLLVGQCKEFPAVIVQGRTLLNIRSEIFDGLEGYFQAFRGENNELIEKHGVLVESQEQKEQIDEKIQKQEQNMIKQQEQLEEEAKYEEQIGEEWQEQKLEKLITVPA
jgi:hypothetical protein